MVTRVTEKAVQPIRVELEGGESHVHLEGMIRVAVARRLKAVALEAFRGEGNVTVHLARAEYLDGAALQVLLALRDGLAEQGRGLQVVSPPPSIEETLRIAGLAGGLGAPAPAVAAVTEGESS